MFVPPTFEPSTPREPQWFPRPITDSIESSLDLLERLEEDRRRRLRGIANVAARTPIGLGGVEDRAHGGAASHVSPKRGHGSNNYQRYRYYPPPSEASASLHASYHSDRLANATPASVTGRSRARNRQRNSRSPATGATGREGARTPVDGVGATSPGAADRAYLSADLSLRSAGGAAAYASPPFDPRAGGGSVVRGGRAVRRIPSPRHYLPQMQQQLQQRSFESGNGSFRIDTSATPTAGSEEYVTPPAMASADQTPGHGRGEDVYSQRRGASQRRRRRGWDEKAPAKKTAGKADRSGRRKSVLKDTSGFDSDDSLSANERTADKMSAKGKAEPKKASKKAASAPKRKSEGSKGAGRPRKPAAAKTKSSGKAKISLGLSPLGSLSNSQKKSSSKKDKHGIRLSEGDVKVAAKAKDADMDDLLVDSDESPETKPERIWRSKSEGSTSGPAKSHKGDLEDSDEDESDTEPTRKRRGRGSGNATKPNYTIGGSSEEESGSEGGSEFEE